MRVILKGGLGNQMFQYAFGKSLALEKNEELLLDTRFLDCRIPVKGFTKRTYDLDLFKIQEKPIPRALPRFLDSYVSYPALKIFNTVNKGYLVEGSNPYKYDEVLVDKASKYRGDIVLEGYWNNYMYFNNHEREIKNIFNVSKLYENKFDEIEGMINRSNSVSINIRRGDYLNSKHKNLFVQLGEQYYSEAIDVIRKRVNKPKFFVFSYDEPDWIQKYLKFDNEELVIVGKDLSGDRFKTYLRLISLCKHNILSNSTFAFWGAYLNVNSSEKRVIISPTRWSASGNFNLPKDWIGVNVNEKI